MQNAGHEQTVAVTVMGYSLTKPDAVALVSSVESVTYRELGRRVSATASSLRGYGIVRGDRIGISMSASPDVVVVILACHLIGAAYVPLDTELPVGRLQVISAKARPSLVVVDTARIESITAADWVTTERCVPFDQLVDAALRADLSVSTELDHLGETAAYVIFTSGSTGEPKGVEVTQGNLSALMTAWDDVMAQVDRGSIADSDEHSAVSLWLSALSFDASVAELFWPLHAGRTLAIAPSANAPSGLGLSLGRFISTHSVTHLQCTPTRATMLMADDTDREALKQIRHMVVGGEALPSSLARDLLATGLGRLTNAYGPTEATVWATVHEVSEASLSEPIVSVGKPINGMRAFVIGEDGRELTDGTVGELLIGGHLVSLGYLDEPELTARSFGTRVVDGKSMSTYRTGDLAALADDGSLVFHGRIDGQIKLRGHRIELGEIEAVLSEHPSVRHAVVELDRRHVRFGEPAQDLVAAVVLHTADSSMQGTPQRISAPQLSAELREYLASRLPSIMVPRSVVTFDALPLSTSGKLDRVAIKALLGGERDQGDTEESGDSLNSMIDDFRTVLPTRSGTNIDAHTNFFDAGGHSLLLVELIYRIQRRTAVSLPLSVLLEAPTPALLCGALHHYELQGAQPDVGYHPLVRYETTETDQARTRRPRLYFIHGAGGHVLRFRPLAMALRDYVEVIGVQAIGLEGAQVADDDISVMAVRYADEIAAHDSGPVHLGGYSDGGVIAVHVVELLRLRGVATKSLTFADTFDPQDFPQGLAAKLKNVIHNVSHRDELKLSQWIRGAVEGWKRRTDWDAEGAAALKRIGYNDVFDSIQNVVKRSPKPVTVDVPGLLLRTFTENPVRCRDYSIAYGSPASVEVVWVSGKHDELFTDTRSSDLADHIRAFVLSHR